MTAQFIVRLVRESGNSDNALVDINVATEIQDFGQALGDAAYLSAFGEPDENSRGIPGGAQLIVVETQSETAMSFTRTAGGAWVIASVPYDNFPEPKLEPVVSDAGLTSAANKILEVANEDGNAGSGVLGGNPNPLSEEEVAAAERGDDGDDQAEEMEEELAD